MVWLCDCISCTWSNLYYCHQWWEDGAHYCQENTVLMLIITDHYAISPHHDNFITSTDDNENQPSENVFSPQKQAQPVTEKHCTVICSVCRRGSNRPTVWRLCDQLTDGHDSGAWARYSYTILFCDTDWMVLSVNVLGTTDIQSHSCTACCVNQGSTWLDWKWILM